MQIFRDLTPLRQHLCSLRARGRSIALVPTMGALHAGHLSLVQHASTLADDVVVSIFVNPRQFGPNEDLARYPRQEQADAALLKDAGVEALWMPGVDVVYPPGFETTVQAGALADVMCGAVRPGHFDGVVTVVTKLFNQVGPHVALFGEKDFQQLAIIRRCVRDLDIPVSVIGVPTARAEDGLALSSRNAYLSAEDREAAAALPRALQTAVAALRDGQGIDETLHLARNQILTAGFASIDYLDLRDPHSLLPVTDATLPARLFVAARIGNTRLIDNLSVVD